MKKISVVLALLMMMGISGVASSVSLSWGTPLQDGSFITDPDGSASAADFGFGHIPNNTSFSHDWNFPSSDASSAILALLIELPHEKTDITNVTFDGAAMSFDTTNQRWFGNGAHALDHIIHAGSTALDLEGLQCQLKATVSNVSVPAAIWLFGSGIVALLCFKSQKSASKALTA